MAKDGEIWLRAWLAVAPSFNAKVADCTRYADVCLEEYRKRFGESDKDLPTADDVRGILVED